MRDSKVDYMVVESSIVHAKEFACRKKKNKMNWLENFKVIGLSDFAIVFFTSCDNDMMLDAKCHVGKGVM